MSERNATRPSAEGNRAVAGVVVSRADEASTHIGSRLRDLADWVQYSDHSRPDAEGGGEYYRLTPGSWMDGQMSADTLTPRPVELRTFDELHIQMDDPVPAFTEEPAVVVFASRHSGDTGPLLTCHFTGNFGSAEFGGNDGRVAPAAPGTQRALVRAFKRHAPPAYDVGIECTHHGPTDVSAPAVFAELGSGPDEWADADGARAVARAILDAAAAPPVVTDDDGCHRHLIGIGGGHYAPRFERVITGTAWGVGHVASEWQLEKLGDPTDPSSRETLARVKKASGAGFALVDGNHPAVTAVLEDIGVRVVSETWVRAVDDRPLGFVAEVEEDLSPIRDGLRFGQVRDRSYEVVKLPDAVLDAARVVDAERTRAIIEANTVAFETTEGGSRAGGLAAVPAAEVRDELIDELGAILEERYETVARQPDAVVVREMKFDPELATEHGVPEGPAFGRLADGQAVEIDGERIEPEEVHREREERFPI